MGAHLVNIDSAAENTFVATLAKSYAEIGDWAWIGLTRGSDNLFYWFDGTKPLYTNWNANEPNNIGSREQCAHLYVNIKAKWNDESFDLNVINYNSGTTTTTYICERGKFTHQFLCALLLDIVFRKL